MLNMYGYVEFMNVSEYIFLEWEFGKCQGVCAYIIDFFFGGGGYIVVASLQIHVLYIYLFCTIYQHFTNSWLNVHHSIDFWPL